MQQSDINEEAPLARRAKKATTLLSETKKSSKPTLITERQIVEVFNQNSKKVLNSIWQHNSSRQRNSPTSLTSSCQSHNFSQTQKSKANQSRNNEETKERTLFTPHSKAEKELISNSEQKVKGSEQCLDFNRSIYSRFLKDEPTKISQFDLSWVEAERLQEVQPFSDLNFRGSTISKGKTNDRTVTKKVNRSTIVELELSQIPEQILFQWIKRDNQRLEQKAQQFDRFFQHLC